MVDRKWFVVLALCAAACGGGSSSASGPAPSAPTPAPVPAPAPILTITELTAGVFGAGGGPPNGGSSYPTLGQSLVITQPYSYSGVRFRWLDDKGNGLSLAAGASMTILTREYLGLARNIGPATPGFLAQSVRTEGSDYVFDEGVVLNTGATYWFLENVIAPKSLVYATQGNVDRYPGGDYYSAASVSDPFVRVWVHDPSDRIDVNFRLSGRIR